jgi:arylsulfatase A-like enzyme
MKRPNILFIMTDQQSATMMSCAGNKYLDTPAIDSIAASGIRFDRAYCANPVCIPSRFALFTGRYPSAVGLRSNDVSTILGEIPEEIKQNGLGYRLKAAGYKALYGGKQHLPKMRAVDLGFDYFCEDERENLADACADILMKPFDQPFFMTVSFINPHDICYMAIAEFAKNLNLNGITSDSNPVEGLLKRGETELKCLKEALKIPEGMSEEHFFKELCPPLPPNFESQENEPEAIWAIKSQRQFKKHAHENFTDKQWRMHRWAYCKLTERVDSQIATVLNALKASGHEDDTVVIFTSDHGDMDSAHRMEHKTALYEEACRIPMIIKYPSEIPEGLIDSKHLISNGLDLIPTIMDYADIEQSEELKGKSLRHLHSEINNSGTYSNWRTILDIESEFGHAVVTDKYKYILYDNGENREQLMDLEYDPHEMRNSLEDSEHRDIIKSFRSDIINEAFAQ